MLTNWGRGTKILFSNHDYWSTPLPHATKASPPPPPPPKKKKITCIMIILLWEYTKCLHNTCIFLFFYFNIGFVTDILSLPNFQNIKPFFIFMNLWNNEAFFIFGLTKLWNKEPYLILDQRAFGIMNHISVLN